MKWPINASTRLRCDYPGQDGYLIKQSAAEIGDRINYLLNHADQRQATG
ncbi:MAG: hypothetical protein WA939_16300 [Nodosilinea sp.]